MSTSDSTSEMTIPKFVFVIPYRDRQEQYEIFVRQMAKVLADVPFQDYRMFFIHQCDTRSFNRGALKNIGFLVVKSLYPEHYHDITLVFNDVDTFPSESGIITNYETQEGVVKHFYGFTFTLGGIVSIRAKDFESIRGFPNYWAWGYEDNMLSKRVGKAQLTIDRSNFYAINDPKIVQIQTTVDRVVNQGEFNRYMQRCEEGIHSITNLVYEISSDGLGTGRPSPTAKFVQVRSFDTEHTCRTELDRVYDTRNKSAPFSVGYSARRHAKMNLVM